MFLPSSRYADQPTATVPLAGGGEATIVTLRRLPPTPGEPWTVHGGDRLDVMAQRLYDDPTRFWHVADANPALEAGRLTDEPGAVILVPER